MTYVIDQPAVATLAVEGETGRFPIRRVYCVGRNYAEHAREMGHDPDREPPFFFLKPADAILTGGADFPYPPGSQDVHYEIEMVAALKSGGKDIAEADAMSHVYGYGVALDMTRRDLQGEAKKMGRPWDTGKGFDKSAPCTDLKPASQIGHPAKGRIWLKVNGETKQESDLSAMIWTIPEMIAYLSRLFELKAGDIILTGTPAGVGAVKKGDVLEGGVDGVGTLKTKVV